MSPRLIIPPDCAQKDLLPLAAIHSQRDDLLSLARFMEVAGAGAGQAVIDECYQKADADDEFPGSR